MGIHQSRFYENHFRRILFHIHYMIDYALLAIEVAPFYDMICPLYDSAFTDHLYLSLE